MKIIKIKKCVECPNFKKCKVLNKNSRVAIMLCPGAVDIHPECPLEDYKQNGGK